ncbi:MAG: hypothetical protein NTV94_13430 [Planctomycetota bacterium]|nr:hypothetical protein [Planctomycetota bacterium]
MDRQDVHDERHRTVTARRDEREGQQERDLDDSVAHVDVRRGAVVAAHSVQLREAMTTCAIAKSF